MKIIKIFIITLALSVLLGISGYSQSREKAGMMLSEYFDLLASGNIESASYFWSENCRERALKFNIEYNNIPLKEDCTSPIIRNLELMKYYLNPSYKTKILLTPSNYTKLEFSNKVDGIEVKHDYYTANYGGTYWLIYPQDYYSRSWPSIETKYLNIIYHHSLDTYLNQVALNQADKFIENIADSIGLSKADLKLIEEKKITYFYCDSDKTVKKITGHLIKGTYDLASDDIISAFFPHYHEIVHFLINLKLRKLPLYSLPIFREGIAVNFGGRWGKATTALMPVAVYLYKENFISIDSILTMKDFEKNASSDMSYIMAGLFNSYLVDKLGTDNYMRLYLQFSAEMDSLLSLTLSEIKNVIVQKTKNSDWESLLIDFNKYTDLLIKNKSNTVPGKIDKGKQIFSNDNFVIYENKDWVGLEISSQNEKSPEGNILFGMQESLKGKNSFLLSEHYKGQQPFEGFRWGIRYDRNEIGFYDYATNHLIGKYIWGITPSDEYYIKSENKIFIKFRKSIASPILDIEKGFKILQN